MAGWTGRFILGLQVVIVPNYMPQNLGKMAPATEVGLSTPLHKRQSDCPVLFPVDCGDGYCCGPLATCVESGGSTRCSLSGNSDGVPAVPGGATPSEQYQDMRCHNVLFNLEHVLIVAASHSLIDEHFFSHITCNQHLIINRTGLH